MVYGPFFAPYFRDMPQNIKCLPAIVGNTAKIVMYLIIQRRIPGIMMQKLLIALCFTTTFTYAQTTAPRADTTAAGTFTLGEVVVSGRQHQNINAVVSAAQLKAFAKNDVAKAINLLPGVNLSAVGPRNESMVYVRGFDLRQVPCL